VRTISVWFIVVYKSAEEKLQAALASPSMHMVARTLPPPCSASGHVGGRRAPAGMTFLSASSLPVGRGQKR
jgi:hypothetical protein